MAVVIGSLAVFAGLGDDPSDRERHDMFSSLSPAPDGTKALYTLLGDLGYGTRRSLVPLDGIDRDGTDVVVMVQPLLPLSPAEHDALVGWIEEGGTVLLAGRMMDQGPLGQLSFAPDDLFAMHHPDQTGAGGWTRETPGPEQELLAGVERFEFASLVGGSTTTVPVGRERASWRMGAHEVLVTRQGSGFVEVTTAGEGRVIKIAEEELVTNQSIRLGHNLAFVLNALEAHGGRGRVAFDEAHRSLVAGAEPGVWDVLGPASGVAFLQLVLAVLAGLVAVGARPAPPLPDERPRRRRALEQIEALASMMERAGAARLAAGLLGRRARHLWQAGRLASGPAGRTPELARRQEARFAGLEALAGRIASGGRASARDLVRCAALLGQIGRGGSTR
jgi:hypothetical protein